MKKLISFIFILAYSLSAQSISFSDQDHQIINSLFNGNWEKSDSLIENYYSNHNNQVKYNFLKAYNYFYTRYVGNNNPYSRDETIRQVQKYAWDAILLGEENEENIENSFFTGSAYAVLARVNVMSQDFWAAYWNATKAENYFDYIIDQNPNVTDSYFNLGVFEYFPAVAITGFQSTLAWFGGMSGDREEGISKMLKVSENGDLFREEANYALALMYGFRESDFTLAYKYWSTLNEKFPMNNNFAVQKERAYFTKLIDDRGVKFLEEEFDSLEARYNVNNPNVLNNIGYNLINQERLDDALLVFKLNLKKYPEVANCYDSLAECYMNLGDNENAIKYYKLAFEKIKTDTTINDQFREFLEEGIKNNLEELGSSIDV